MAVLDSAGLDFGASRGEVELDPGGDPLALDDPRGFGQVLAVVAVEVVHAVVRRIEQQGAQVERCVHREAPCAAMRRKLR